MQSVSQASVFLGVDAHAETCTFCAIDGNGKTIMLQTVPTDARQLRDAARRLPERTWAMVEASAMSIFVRNALAEVVDRVIVCETRENRLIAKSEDKSDEKDAWRLARLLRMGEFKAVHVPMLHRQEIREMIRAYQQVVGDSVRAKNRIHAMFRKHGIRVTEGAYAEGRHDVLRRLGRPGLKTALDGLYSILDAAEDAKDDLSRSLCARLSPTREYKLLLTIPGVGPVCAAIMVAVIDTPHRFPDKRNLWSYAGIGASKRSSAKTVFMKGMSGGNRLLKYAAMTAAQNAIKCDNRFARYYQAAVEENTDQKKAKKIAAMAKKAVARGILAAVLAMWKTGTAYREDKQAVVA
jgi:transposase